MTPGGALGSFELFSINRSRAARHAVMRFGKSCEGAATIYCAISRSKTAREPLIFCCGLARDNQ
jgi:hypothetical protein